MPGPNVTLLLEVYTDGCTYTSANALMAFEDESVASLVADELNCKFSGSHYFETQKVPVSASNDEGAVAGLVEALVAKHKLARE